MMKYLKKSERSLPFELIDLFDLQIELLKNGLENDSVRQYSTIATSFREKCIALLELAKTDYPKLRRIMSNTTEGYKKFYVPNDEDFFETGIPVLYLNPLNKRIVDFYFLALNHAFESSNTETFNYFYNDLTIFLKKLTNKNTNKQKIHTKDFFSGEDVIRWEARLMQMFHEIMRHFIYLLAKEIPKISPDSEQKIYCVKLYWQLFFELILDPEFEPLMIDETIDYWEHLFTDFIVDSVEVEGVCTTVARELHIYSDQLKYGRQELQYDSFHDYHDLVAKCMSIISRRDFITFEKELNERFDNDDSNKEYKVLLRVASLTIKVSLLRMALLRVYANAISVGKIELVLTMLFARQPLNSNFINGNEDFFPTNSEYIRKFLRVYKNQRHFGLNPLRYDDIGHLIDKAVVIWLYRNSFWHVKRNSYRMRPFNLGEISDGYEVGQLVNALNALLSVCDEPFLAIFPNISSKNQAIINGEIFKRQMEDEIARISEGNQSAILEAEVDEKKKKRFIGDVLQGISNYSGLFNLFNSTELIEEKESDFTINSVEYFDKKPFIPDGIAAAVSINALEVYPSQCYKNFSTQRDFVLARELKKRCRSELYTISEMEEYFLNNSFEDKIIITHYVHMGYEMLRDQFSYEDFTFKNKANETFKIQQISSFNDLKFVFVVDESAIKSLIQSSTVEVDLDIHIEDRMKAISKVENKFRINEIEGFNGEFFTLR